MSLVLPHCKEHSFPRLTAAAGWIWILFPPWLINGELPVLTATAGAIYRLNLMVRGFISLLYQSRCWAVWGAQIQAAGIVLAHTCGHPEVNLNKLDSLEGVGTLSVLIYVFTLSCSGETYL